MSSIRKRKKKKADNKGLLLLLISASIFIAIGYFFIEANLNTVKRDPNTSCRLDGKVTRETAIIIDATDNFSKTQAMLIKKEIDQVFSNSIIDEQFTLYVLNESIDETSIIVKGCNAGDGSEESELTSNKRRLKKEWNDNFYNKFTNAVEDLIGINVARQSPIFEMMKYVSINTMYDSKAESKKIIFVSDMLHHNSQYSQYRNKHDFNSFTRLAYSLETKPHLQNVDVDILYVVRAKDIKLQNRGHIAFWDAFVTNAGGQILRVKTIN